MLTKLRFKIELYYRYFKKNRLYFIFGILFGIIIVTFHQQIFAFYQKINHQSQKIGLEGQYTLNTLPPEIANKISYGLTLSSDGNKFEISPLVSNLDIKENNTQYIFELNSNIYWHKGKKFSASDINYKIPGLTISIINSNHINIQTEKPFAPILSTLSEPLIKKNFDGLGEYRVTRFSYRDGYLKTLSLRSANNSILYRFYQNETDLLNAFKIGEVDTIELTTISEEINAWPKIDISQEIKTDQRYIAVFLNTEKLNNKQLRQALAYATPKTNDLNERTFSPISPISWAYNPNVKEYAFDTEKAIDFITDNKIESINLTYNDRRLVNIADNIKKNWEEILGIKVNAQISTQIDTQNYDAILAYGSIPVDPDQYLFWHSTQNKTNLTKINNPRIDKLLEEGRQTSDQQERKKIYQEFQKILLEECPAIFLKYPIVYTISRN